MPIGALLGGLALKGAGKLAKKAVGAVGGLLGKKKAGTSGKKRHRRSINALAKDLLRAKIKAKKDKIALSPLKGL